MTSPSIITTLFEGDYVLGLGALLNSLHAHGYRGRVYAGYRGELRDWTQKAVADERGLKSISADGIEIKFIELETDWHLANMKPDFTLRVWDTWEPEAAAMFYFDPDIVVKCAWSFFERWASYGVAMCEERHMPIDHPLHVAWKEWATDRGWDVHRPLDGYINSGFVGVTASQRGILELWKKISEGVADSTRMEVFFPGDRTEIFRMADQDALNVAAMIHPGPLSRMGGEGMDIGLRGFTMSHALGRPKPWRKQFVRSAVGGTPPTVADKGWAGYLESPIAVRSAAEVRAIQRSIKVACAIGRFTRRT